MVLENLKTMSKFTDYLEYLVASTNFHEKVVHGKKAEEISRIFEKLFFFSFSSATEKKIT